MIKDKQAIEKMRIAGQLASRVLVMIEDYIVPGVTTNELNDIIHNYIVHDLDAIPTCLGYHGFPKSVCISVNNISVHGVPSDYVIRDGDLVSVDIVVKKDGYNGDTCKTFIVGNASKTAINVVKVTNNALYLGISMVKPGVNLKDIGRAIEEYVLKRKLSVVYEYCGHGIGLEMHEHPSVLHYDDESIPDFILQEGMTFTIEPMVNVGTRHTKILQDNWSVATKDGKLCAHAEHTLLVTKTGCEVLTIRPDDVLLNHD